jgi:NitT/TauT family transport system substrate-binding protein
MERKSFLMLCCAGILTTFLVLPSKESFGKEKILFTLNYTWQAAHTLILPISGKGFYAEEGLDVEIKKGIASGDTVKRVDVGTTTFGLADTSSVIEAMAAGAKIKIIGMLQIRPPHTLFALKSSGINKPKDLEGKTIGGPPTDANIIVFPVFAELTGIDASKVKIVPMDVAAKTPMLLSKKIDCAGFFIDAYPRIERGALKQNDSVVIFKYYDYGFKAYGLALVGSEKMMKENPELIKKFLRATYKGILWSMENYKEAVEVTMKMIPEVDRELMEQGGKMNFDLILAPEVYEKGIGWVSKEKMEYSRDIFSKYAKLSKTVPVEEIYTNQFLPNLFPKK